MGLTITLVDSGEGQYGQLRYQLADVLFDSSYPTGGEALPTVAGVPTVGGVRVLGAIYIGAADATSAGIIPVYKTNGKILAMKVAGFTPAGTISGNVTVVGGGVGEAIGINPDSNAGVLSKAAATNRTIPIATFLGAAPTFTGTAVAISSLVEVGNGVSLSTTTVRMQFIGT